MRIAVAGSTGVVGRRALPLLAAAGHDVTALVRDEPGERFAEAAGVRVVRGDLAEPRSLEHAFRGAEVVVNLASAIPVVPRPAAQDWVANDRVRRDGTRNALTAAVRVGASHYVHTSVYLVYGDDCGDALVDEAAPLRPAPPIRSAVDGEALVAAAPLDWTILRPGWLYDAGAWHTEALLEQLRAGTAVVLRDAPAWRSPLHAEDLARAVGLVVDRRPAGAVLNVADAEPVRAGELLDGLAALLGAPPPERLDEAQVVDRLGPASAAALRRSMRLATERLERLGFVPRHRSWREGFRAVVDELDERAAV